MKHLKIYTDGGARGNPGPGAFGVVIKNENSETIYQKGESIGRATNNQAEYQGLIAGLEWVVENCQQVDKVKFFLDSKLVVNQMRGDFKVKSINIRPLWRLAKKLAKKIEAEINYTYIPREKNSEADALLNEALDQN